VRCSPFPAHHRLGGERPTEEGSCPDGAEARHCHPQATESGVHHSDRGSQYCSDDYQKLLTSYGFIASLSGKGNCYDNAMVETVFKTRCAAEMAIGHYIEAFYNPIRRHSALGFSSPIQFEREALGLAV
jgi:transposase InsO family protein